MALIIFVILDKLFFLNQLQGIFEYFPEFLLIFCTVSSDSLLQVFNEFFASRMDALPSSNLRQQKLEQQRQLIEQKQKMKRQQQVQNMIEYHEMRLAEYIL